MKKLLSLLSLLIMSTILCSIAFSGDETYGANTGSITGQIAVKGKGPLAGGTVFFFDEQSGPPPSATRYWRVPTHSFSIDNKGRFSASLPLGKYYMGASHKLSGERLGPPKEGDLFFISSDKKGKPKLHTVMQYKPLDLGVIEEAEPFSPKTLVTEGITSVQGTITDNTGKPAEGMLVFAYPTPAMFGRPLFVSERSDSNGRYLLRLYGGGTYYLGSRAHYGGGPPTADQVVGSYSKGKPLAIKTGEEIKGIHITVSRVGVAE